VPAVIVSDARVRADADDQLVRPWPELGGDVENRRREAGQMLADLPAVEPHCRSELCLVDAQNRDGS